MNIAHLLHTTASHSGERVATRWGGQEQTYAELAARVRSLAGALLALGLRPGDRVGFLMWNRPEVVETLFACWHAGLAVVPLNPRLTADEVVHHLSDPEAVALVHGPEFADLARAAREQVPSLEHVVPVGPTGEGTYEALVGAHIGAPPPVAEVGADELAWLFYTSGTTGRPKGAMITHGTLGFVTLGWVAEIMPLRRGDVALHAAPLTHGAGFHMLAATSQACTQVMTPEPSLDAAATLDLIEREGVTNTWMVPTQVVRLVQEQRARPRDLGRLHSLLYGGAPYHQEALREAVDLLGSRLVQLYGQGETPMTATYLPHEDHDPGGDPDRLTSAGIVRTGMRVRVVDEHDQECPDGVAGEICVQGPAVMKGYWRRPEDTARTLRGGWLHTGDVGYFSRGYLHVTDRIKDLIISGGSNVYAKEVEDVILTHPGVREVAVVGLPDPDWGERVTAVVVPHDLTTFDPQELRDFCGARMAAYKKPKEVVVLPDLPLSTYGKVLKRELRDRLAQERTTT